MPWATRVWAAPCLPVLAPSARDHQARGQRHKPWTAWARQLCLVARREAPSAPPLGAGAGSARQVRAPGMALHGADRGPRAAPGVVRAAVASGGQLAGGPCPPGHGAPATVERAGHGPHPTSLAGPVLDDHAVGRPAGAGAHPASRTGGMVAQRPATLGGCHRDCPAPRVDLYPCLPVTGESRPGGKPLDTAEPLDRDSLVCGVHG
jgi:hypothetical protein